MERKPRKTVSKTKKQQESVPIWLAAVQAAQAKKAINVKALDLREVTSFADFFVICSGANQRQIQAICDEVGTQLKKIGETPNSVEGYNNAEWILMDYGDCLVHVFSEKAREYYELERLWRHGKELEVTAE